MGQPLRITYNNSDHIFKISDNTPVTKATNEIPILLGDKEVTLIKDGSNMWISKESDETIDASLIQAIGKAISLRYRI